jgi:hypothetical protein
MIPWSSDTNSLFWSGREFASNALELLHELTLGIAKMAKNSQIPCYFPWSAPQN